MFNDNHFAVGPELHGGKAGRQAVWVVKCSPGHQKRLPKLQVFAVGVNIFSKLSVDVYVSANGCLSLCGPAMNWRLIQGVPYDSWDRLQQY